MKNNKDKQSSWSAFLAKKQSTRQQQESTGNSGATGNTSKEEAGLVRIELSIGGMTCTSCEHRIDQKLRHLEGVQQVQVSYSDKKAVIEYDPGITTREKLVEAIIASGYTVNNKKKHDGFSPLQLIGIGVILAALWLVLAKTGVFSLIPEVKQSMGYGLLFIVGLLTSLHCIAMCGGINLSQSVKREYSGKEKILERVKPGFLYNLGRLISYTVIGGIVGALGSVISISGTAQGVVVIIVGILMMIMGINMLNIFPWLGKLVPRLPRQWAQRLDKLKTKQGPLIVGMLNGFMPCGPLQSIQLYALGTGSFLAGATSMFLFSLGTIPLMLGFGVIGSLLTGKFTSKMMKISALLVFLLGFGMVGRGFALSGVTFSPGSVNTKEANVAVIKENYQVVESDVYSSNYEPIIVQKGIPVKWTLRVTQEELNGCNNPITVPSYGIKKQLAAGDNLVEFTPEQSGNLTFTCWMGMITSTIKVVDSLAGITESDLADINNQPAGGGASCCSSGAGGDGSAFTPVPEVTIPVDNIVNARVSGDTQEARININERGFVPAIIVLQRGLKTKLDFYGETLDDDNYRILVPAYNSRMQLKEGENIVEFVPELDFTYMSWTSTLYGLICVVDDISKVDLNDIRTRAETAAARLSQPQAAGGGCCGS